MAETSERLKGLIIKLVYIPYDTLLTLAFRKN